jgi:hypothetical protein
MPHSSSSLRPLAAVGRLASLLVPLIGSLLLSGCQTGSVPRVQTERSPTADFSAYRTFAVLPPSGGVSTVPPSEQMRLGGPMRSHLEARLLERGLKAVPTDQADIVFELVGTVTPEITLYPSPMGMEIYRRGPFLSRYPLGYYYSTGTMVATTDRGMLSLMAYNSREKSAVWAAWVEGNYAPGVKLETVTATLDAMLATLPAR